MTENSFEFFFFFKYWQQIIFRYVQYLAEFYDTAPSTPLKTRRSFNVGSMLTQHNIELTLENVPCCSG